MPATDWGWLITPEEFESWIVSLDDRCLAVNKPGTVVCHPSKFGPWSSLIGAAREYLGAERLHMPSRLDRETSGIVVFARDAAMATRLQTAIHRRRAHKTYLAVLTGVLPAGVTVTAPIGRAEGSQVIMKRGVDADGQSAETHFEPLSSTDRYTLARVTPHTGRLHQIRVHAAMLGHAIAGDKLYGPDETLFLEFIRDGFTPRLQASLPLRRHALHASRIEFRLHQETLDYAAPVTEDLRRFCESIGLSVPSTAE